jgi:hypothetical protein
LTSGQPHLERAVSLHAVFGGFDPHDEALQGVEEVADFVLFAVEFEFCPTVFAVEKFVRRCLGRGPA